MDVFLCVVDNRNIFWVTSMIYCFIRRCCIVAVAPPPHHPSKVETCYGHVCLQWPLAVQQHMKIHDYIFHPSYVAQWQSVCPRNMRSSVRITGKPMVLKVRRKIERSWSCDQCHVLWSVWCWALDGRSLSNVDLLDTWYMYAHVDCSAWIRASENTLKCMVKTSSHVLRQE